VLFGVGFGVWSAVIVARRWLVALEKKGETRASLATILIAVGALFVFSAVWTLLAFSLSNALITVFFDFVSPFIPVLFAVQAYLFRSWERKHNKFIMSGTWTNRLYVYPYP
jgi:hypothetical protein